MKRQEEKGHTKEYISIEGKNCRQHQRMYNILRSGIMKMEHDRQVENRDIYGERYTYIYNYTCKD